MNNYDPVIRRVKKIKKGGHHGGAWKIALADFALAMMAFFLVLWIINVSSPEELAAIEGYFNDPAGMSTAGFSNNPIDLGGSPAMSTERKLDMNLPDPGSTPDLTDEESMRTGNDGEELEKMNALLIEQFQSLDRVNSNDQNMRIEITPEGVRITLIDDPDKPMFERGSAQLVPDMENTLMSMAAVFSMIENPVVITGHTDASGFTGTGLFDNWDLSSLRANAAKKALVEGGLEPKRIAQVIGLADSVPYNRVDPASPENRRISVTLLTDEAYKRMLESSRRRFGGEQVELDPNMTPENVF
ncbi:Chemotaxis protein LafU [Marinomonas gallaica]|uniref:Chemotaxis protein LafU n=1 Tax=Marinomonas gallaica TaxID=1806667 RepID=A0A1C3JST7_9GAMM|nr:flagellar motor protein MotB [Marinomonas gallaica]SBT18293.1 Chemotaxis protein LafU [Marinomonas gallaica]SBT22343.1 Chemotaxis protein LafU [Marinomonas gallaica]